MTYHRHVLAFETIVDHVRRVAEGREPTYDFCAICNRVPTELVAKTPELVLTPPPGEALPPLAAPIAEDPRQTEYRRKRRAWRALYPIKEVADFGEADTKPAASTTDYLGALPGEELKL